MLLCGIFYYDSGNCNIGQVKPWGVAGQLDSVHNDKMLGHRNGKGDNLISLCTGFAAGDSVKKKL
jgi:hypothetical protein